MPEITIRRLSPELLPDWLTFFDGEAFSDNPQWASCYCYFYHNDHPTSDWGQRSGPDNRAASSGLILRGRMQGYLAFVGEKPVGWCQAAPRLQIPNLQHEEELVVDDASQVGSIVCFIVAPQQRRNGVARRLLDAACAGFREQGLAFAEAYPRKDMTSDASNYHGPLDLYLAAGFQVFRESGSILIVRKVLETPAPD